MRFTPIFVALFLAATEATAVAQKAETKVIENGAFWSDLPETARVMWLSGFVHGTTTASVLLGQIYTPTQRRPQQSAGCAGAKVADFTHIQLGQFESGLDNFYKDFRNTRIHMEDAMILVRDEISGCPVNILEQEVSIYRRIATAEGYDD